MESEITPSGDERKKSRKITRHFSVGLDPKTGKNLADKTKSLGITNGKFASAAVDFFIRNGLDPTDPTVKTMDSLEVVLRKEMAAGFEELADKTTQNTNKVGNRLVTILRAWERDSYEFMLQQQKQTHNYIEQVEANLLKSFVAMETHMLAPMHEQIAKVNGEATMALFLTERILSRAKQMSPDDEAKQHKIINDDKSRIVIEYLREYLRLHPVVQPTLTLKPTIMKAPPIAAPKPKVPAVAPATPTQTPT